MAITQSTQVFTVLGIHDAVLQDGVSYKQIECTVAPDTGTTKLHFNGLSGFVTGTGATPNSITFHMKATGAGTLPAVGDTINCVLG